MLVKLTNANTQNNGMPIVINFDMVVSVNRMLVPTEDGSLEEKTILYIPPHGNWEVRETIEEVMELVEAARKACS